MDEGLKNKVWDILVTLAGAMEGERDQFLSNWPECREFRFCGKLGFGGKIWGSSDVPYVTCYQEDQTSERAEVIKVTNVALAELFTS